MRTEMLKPSRARVTLLLAVVLGAGCTLISGGADLHVEDKGDGGGSANDAKSIACENQTCVGDDVCCTPASGAWCTTDWTNCVNDLNQGAYMSCDGPEDCTAGQICCIDVVDYFGWVECRAAGDCWGAYAQLACHGGGDCPAGMSCQSADYANGFFVPTLFGCKW